MRPGLRWVELGAAAALLVSAASAQEAPLGSDSDRLDRLERENTELSRRLDLLAGEFEGLRLGDVIPPLGEGRPGLGPAASKVYGVEHGLSIGGYGEALYQRFEGSGETDQLDFLRAVLYFGYRFDERWLLNTEIEVEHADEIGVEFAYLDYLASPALNLRAGLLLVPMGFVNELHEPTTFHSALRPGVETRILPTTWRENGVGVHGELGDFVYRTWLVTGFDAMGFEADGLRDGRQKGSKALAEDFAWTGRADWMGLPGTTLGVAAWVGDSDQDQIDGADVGTTIVEGHAEWRWRGWRARGLYALAELDDVAALNGSLGIAPGSSASVGDELEGWYLELGYDLLSWLRPGSGQELTPFVRYETLDTQASVPSGFSADPANDLDIVTWGISYSPTAGVVLKTDYMTIEDGSGADSNQFNVAIGYSF